MTKEKLFHCKDTETGASFNVTEAGLAELKRNPQMNSKTEVIGEVKEDEAKGPTQEELDAQAAKIAEERAAKEKEIADKKAADKAAKKAEEDAKGK